MPILPLLAHVLLSVLPQSPSLPEAAALLDKREATLGPSDVRAKVHGLEIRGRIEMTGGGISASFEELHLLLPEGERVLQTLHWKGWGDTTQGTDGLATWSTDPGFGIMVKEGAAGGAPRRLYGVSRSAPWRSLYKGARTLGQVERGGRALYELEMQLAEGAGDRWYLTLDTNELVRVGIVYPGPTGESLPMEWAFGDWKAVDGVRYPHRRVQEIGVAVEASAGDEPHAPMTSIVYLCESIRPAELDLARLAPPPEVAEALRDPSKRAPSPDADAKVCKLETLGARPVASIRLEIDASQVSATLATIFPEIGRALAGQGTEFGGPPFSRYHSIDLTRGKIDLEAGIPVKAPIQASGRVKASELPAGRAAMTWHVGSYHELQKSYDRLGDWLAEENLVSRGGFWEIYWTDPGLEPDPSSWRTQIYWPVE
jgi:effector-binding domain-containing protein